MTRRRLAMALLACACTGGPDSGGDDSDTPEDTDPNVDLDDVPWGDATPGFRGAITPTDDFECAWEESECPTACDTNQAPVLADPVYVVNGVIGSEFGVGDHLVVRVPYTDPDCNAGCGTATNGYGVPEEAAFTVWTVCSNMPCTSADSEVYLGFVLGVLRSDFDYYFHVRLADGCGDESNRVSGEFRL